MDGIVPVCVGGGGGGSNGDIVYCGMCVSIQYEVVCDENDSLNEQYQQLHTDLQALERKLSNTQVWLTSIGGLASPPGCP